MEKTSPAAVSDSLDYRKPRLVKTAVMLSWFTIAYNLLEGVVSIFFGVSEGSIALAGFGGDSFIEVGSATLVLWRFRSETGSGPGMELERERKSTIGIGILFVFLAVLTAAGASYKLITTSPPDTTVPGFVISSISLSFMFYLWSAKKKVARELDSSTMLKDAACSLACIKLSVILFAGSGLYILRPDIWWADPIAAALLTVFIGMEGWKTIKIARHPDFSGGCGCHD